MDLTGWISLKAGPPDAPTPPWVPPDKWEPSDSQYRRLLELRGGCQCAVVYPPCRACTDPMTTEEYLEIKDC